MAVSKFPTAQYTSEHFVESCGAILFDLAQESKRVCVFLNVPKNEWLLPKGRRNAGESRQDAAIRELTEETGYSCRLLPVKIPTRAPRSDEPPDAPDRVRIDDDSAEPFMVTLRHIKDSEVKIIWWYVAELDRGVKRGAGESGFEPAFFALKEAVERLTFLADREVLQRAISIVEGAF
jgi:8-oxo-dGTP pyrophosphatase MutT (NUDIX family)